MTMDSLIAAIAVFCCISAFLAYGPGMAAYSRNPRSGANHLSLLAMLAVCCWACAGFMIWQADSEEGIHFW